MSRSSVFWSIGSPGWVSQRRRRPRGFTRSSCRSGSRRPARASAGGHRAGARRQRGVLGRGTASAARRVGDLARRRLADRHRLRQVVEVAGGEVAQLRQRSGCRCGFSVASEACTFCSVRMLIIWPVTPRTEFSSSRLQQRRAEVHGDDDVGAHRARHVDRQVVGEAAVDQQRAVDLAPARSRPAPTCWRASRRAARPRSKHDRLAGDEVGGDGAEGDRQLVEVAGSPARCAELAQHGLELHAGDQALGQQQLAVAHADLGANEVVRVVVLQADRAAPARGGWSLNSVSASTSPTSVASISADATVPDA